MPLFVHATWIAREDERDVVADALAELAVHSRREPGNLAYWPCVDPERPERFSIFEAYVDHDAFQAHLDSSHFRDLALQRAIPLLAERRREFLHVLDDAPRSPDH